MFFSEFFWPRHNVFQPEGYIFFGLHTLTYHKPLHFDGFWFCIISWPIGRPPAEWLGLQGGAPPAKAKRRLLRYLKKGNYYLVATNWGGTKQKQITKNNRFEKQQISKISHFRKQHISKTTTNEKKKQISKNNRSQKRTDLLCLEIRCWNLLFLKSVVYEICCFWNLFFFEMYCFLKSVSWNL